MHEGGEVDYPKRAARLDRELLVCQTLNNAAGVASTCHMMAGKSDEGVATVEMSVVDASRNAPPTGWLRVDCADRVVAVYNR